MLWESRFTPLFKVEKTLAWEARELRARAPLPGQSLLQPQPFLKTQPLTPRASQVFQGWSYFPGLQDGQMAQGRHLVASLSQAGPLQKAGSQP